MTFDVPLSGGDSSIVKRYMFNEQAIAQKTDDGLGQVMFNINDHLGGAVAQSSGFAGETHTVIHAA